MMVLALSTLSAQAQTPQLTALLGKMDAASRQFKSATANFQWDYYEKVVHDTSTQTGSIYFKRDGGNVDMGAVIVGADPLNPGSKPTVQTVLQYRGDELQLFNTGPDQIQVFHAGGNQAQYEEFLTLGFGGSGSDLAKAWNITDQGPETMNDDGKPVKVEKLDLVGKTPESRKSITHVTVWVDAERGVSLKQVFYQTGGNVRTATYTNIRLNSAVDMAKFAIKKDKNTTVIQH
jgi:outer membrane lipoprotein-sorting protein